MLSTSNSKKKYNTDSFQSDLDVRFKKLSKKENL